MLMNNLFFSICEILKVNNELTVHNGIGDGPPFLKESFDRILLDTPCSALGQRPQLYNPIRLKELESFPRLQRKLFITVKYLFFILNLN